MEEILRLAERLGKAIADSPQADRLRNARRALAEKKDIEETLEAYRRQADRIAKLKAENSPIEVEDKRRIAELEDKLAASEVFKEFTAAQVEYIDLMRKVNEILAAQLADTQADRSG